MYIRECQQDDTGSKSSLEKNHFFQIVETSNQGLVLHISTTMHFKLSKKDPTEYTIIESTPTNVH